MQELLRCRTCLKKTEPAKCRKLRAETLYDGKALLKMINFCVPELNVNVELDPAMCRKCLKLLNKLYKFKHMCLKNDLKYCKDDLKKITDLNGSSNYVPFIASDIAEMNTAGNNIPHSHVPNNVPGNIDDNQNETPTMNSNINETDSRKKRKRKQFLCYKKRFTNTKCFGCQNRIRDVKYHTRHHSGNCECLVCGQRFTSICEMRKHVYKHVYLHKCKICGKKWRDAYQLSEHLRSHSKQKPFECPECNKRFVQSHNLHQHLSIHKGQKNNQNRCQECGKILSTKYNLKIHLTTHNIGVKPKCPMCDKWFYTETAMIKHSETCIIVKEENEIFFPESEYIKTEVPDYVKEESQSDDDIFIEDALSRSMAANRQYIVDNVKEEKFVKEEGSFF